MFDEYTHICKTHLYKKLELQNDSNNKEKLGTVQAEITRKCQVCVENGHRFIANVLKNEELNLRLKCF